MLSIFAYKIHQSFELPYEDAIDKNMMTTLESTNETVFNSRIYFICRIKKIKIDIKSVRLFWGNLSFKLFIGDKRTKRQYLKLPIFKHAKILREHLTEERITLLINGEKWHIPATELPDMVNLQEDRSPNVIYVGETFNKASRYKTHEKLLKATTIVDHSCEELKIYFQHIKFIYGGYPIEFSTLNELKDINNKAAVKLLERLFIQLFKPELNEFHVEADIFSDPLVVKNFRSNGIDYVHLDLGLNGKAYQFNSAKLQRSNDWYYFDFKAKMIKEGMPELVSF